MAAKVHMAAKVQRQRLFDGVAIGASILCLAHCLLLPVLFVMLPAMATVIAVPETFHVAALVLAVPTSALALIGGYRRHRWARPAMVAIPGIILLAAGALLAPSESAETLLSVAGALLLVLGHVLNWRALHHAAPAAQESVPA